jgi:predicted phage-related endonuclease
MTTQLIHYTSDAHWLSLRAEDITSTEASALFGLSPYATYFEIWHAKHSGDYEALADNDRMQAGRHIEPAIASLVSERFGVYVRPLKVYARDEDARIGSSFDFEIIGVTGGDVSDTRLRDLFASHGPGILECKNVDGLVFRHKWTDDETPAHIEIQAQHQMEVLGTHEWSVVAALVGGNVLEPYIRMRDRAVGKAIRSRAAKFWQSIKDGVEPPPIMPDDAEAVIAMHQLAGGGVFDGRDNDELTVMMARFDTLKASEKAIESELKVLKAQVLQVVGEADSALHAGGKISLAQVADGAGTLITQEMVGTTYGARKGYRLFRNYPAKAKSDE